MRGGTGRDAKITEQGKAQLNAFLQVRFRALASLRDFLAMYGFIEIAESTLHETTGFARNPFASLPVDFTGPEEILLRSSQLQLEALAAGLDTKPFVIAKSFEQKEVPESREEELQLSEATLVELERTFKDQILEVAFDKLLSLGEEALKFATREVVESYHAELYLLGCDLNYLTTIIRRSFVRITYEDALYLLNGGRKGELAFGDPLTREHEEEILSYFCRIPTFVTYSPTALGLFNLKRTRDKRTLYSIDLLVPNAKRLVIGGLHEQNTSLLKSRLQSSPLGESLQKENSDPFAPLERYFKMLQGGRPQLRGGISLVFEEFLRFILASPRKRNF